MILKTDFKEVNFLNKISCPFYLGRRLRFNIGPIVRTCFNKKMYFKMQLAKINNNQREHLHYAVNTVCIPYWTLIQGNYFMCELMSMAHI